MASSKSRIPTYHVAPHFNIAANGGALRLGAVVNDLVELVPLNRRDTDFVPVPDGVIYTSTAQTGFRAARSQLRAGHFGVWAEALGLSGVGGHAGVGGEAGADETVSCDSVVTTYFDPDEEWAAACLAAKPVQDYIVNSVYKAPVYIVTGLKIAANLTMGSAASRGAAADVSVGAAAIPQVPVTVGLGGDVRTASGRALGFQSSDIVVGLRVRKYKYKSKSLFSKEKRLQGKLFARGAEMLDDGTGASKRLLTLEEVPIAEETAAIEERGAADGECWVKR